jgi:anti-sigma regulatory factor (Ser/Thr protein kinase)
MGIVALTGPAAGQASALRWDSWMPDTVRLVHDARAPQRARRWITHRCHDWGCEELSELASLMVTELVTNVYLHTGTACLVQAAYTQPTLSVAVSDEDDSEVSPGTASNTASDTAENGRGLAIVAALSDAWGTRLNGGTKEVWFDLSATNGVRT